MNSRGRSLRQVAAVSALWLAAVSAAMASGHTNGSGSGGGVHMGGGHMGGAAHSVGAVGRPASAGAIGPAGHYFGGGRGYAAGVAASHGSYGAVSGNARGGYARGGYSHGSYSPTGGGYYHGYATGPYWGGGYWRGGYWPGAYYGFGFDWFLPVLPLAYATYWYNSVPYYYANDVYYTWNPDYSGYTATDPPPVAGSGAAAAEGAGATVAGAGDSQIYMYPKNGQSAEQQSIDKQECRQWAAAQAGAGAQGAPSGSNESDYRRAMMACVEGRGYSAN
ncbi:MAG: hypothetical protein M3O06_03930 [Pseudomonadota bacterium]|nr:hypothetical protein [Pseudomonadota bacterium]